MNNIYKVKVHEQVLMEAESVLMCLKQRDINKRNFGMSSYSCNNFLKTK